MTALRIGVPLAACVAMLCAAPAQAQQAAMSFFVTSAGAAQSIAKHAASGTPIRRAVIEVPPDIGAARRPAMAVKNPGNVSLFRPFTRP